MARRKKHHEEAEEGEAWLMSYADLVTLLLAIFVLLFSLSTIDNTKVSQVAKAISTYMNTKTSDQGVSVGDFSLEERQLLAYRKLATFLDLGHPDEVLARLEKIQESPEEIRRLLALAERLGLFGNAKMNHHALRYEIVIPNGMLFEKNQPYLNAKGLEMLKALAPRLRESLRDERRFLEIAGHTDSAPLRSGSEFSSPHILSAARAEAASLTLQQLGIDGSRIQIVGKGSIEPLYPERDRSGNPLETGAEKNRRLVLTLFTEPTLTMKNGKLLEAAP
jgi:chemotaxis protein MotB